jgi:hypothetical protein
VARILHSAARRASDLLAEHRAELEKLSRALEAQEVLDESEIESLLGRSVNRRSELNGRPPVDVAPGSPKVSDIVAEADT